MNFLKNAFLLILFVAPAGSTYIFGQSKHFERADIYLNLNECVNCHMFLRNYVITLQNSDTLMLHMDKSAESFGISYIISKGIDVNQFQNVIYEDILYLSGGFFESFIIVRKDGEIDTLMLQDPLVLEENFMEPGNIEQQYLVKLTLSERLDFYYGDSVAVLTDYLLNQSFKIAISERERLVFQKVLFELSLDELMVSLKDRFGLSFDLTRSIGNILNQIGVNQIRFESFSLTNDSVSALMSIPFVYSEKKDTIISSIYLLWNSDLETTKLIEPFTKFEGQEFEINTSLGFTAIDNQVYIPLMPVKNSKMKYILIGRYVDEGLGELKCADVIKINKHQNFDGGRFYNEFYFLNNDKIVYNLLSGKRYDFDAIKDLETFDLIQIARSFENNDDLHVLFSNKETFLKSTLSLQFDTSIISEINTLTNRPFLIGKYIVDFNYQDPINSVLTRMNN